MPMAARDRQPFTSGSFRVVGTAPARRWWRSSSTLDHRPIGSVRPRAANSAVRLRWAGSNEKCTRDYSPATFTKMANVGCRSTPYAAAAGLLVGFAVGLTGMGNFGLCAG